MIMKKLIITALSTILVTTTAMGLTACGEKYKYDFMVDGEVYQSVILDKDFVKPEDPTKTGYTFAGWFIEGSDVAYTDFSVKLEADVQLVAKWTVNQYSISFDSDGGSNVTAITQDYNSSVTAPETPVKEHYDFVGWFEEGASAPYTFNKIEARDVALKAEWAAKEYSITFNTDGGSQLLPLIAAYGSSISAPAVPYKDGYGFIGWYEEGSDVPYVFDTMGEDITLTARWSEGYHAIYELYKFSQDLDSRYINEDDITVEVGGEEYVIGGAAFTELGARPGRILSIEVDTNVYAHIFVITAKLRTADEVANMFYATSHYLFNAENGDVPGNVHQHGSYDYLMLDADVDMAGKSIVKSMNPYDSGNSYRLWGFRGTFDGNGHVIYNLNDSMFRKLSSESVVKNVSIIAVDGNGLLAGEIFGKIDNVYIKNTIVKNGANTLSARIDPSAKITNSVFVVENTGRTDSFYAIAQNATDADFTDSFVLTNVAACFEDGKAPATLPGVYALGAKVEGNFEGFTADFWDLTGDYPTIKLEIINYAESKFAWGLNVLNATNDGRIGNQNGLAGTLSTNETFFIPYEFFKLNQNIGSTYPLIAKTNQDKLYTVYVTIGEASINNANDWENIGYLTGYGPKSNTAGNGYFVLAADIDVAGVTPKWSSLSHGYNEASWGFGGTFDGNGHSLINPSDYIFGQLKTGATIKNLTVKDSTCNYIIWACGALTVENCNFSMVGSNQTASQYIFGCTGSVPVKGNLKVKNCEFYFGVNNYSPNALAPKFAKYDGSITVTLENVTIKTWYSKVQIDRETAMEDYDLPGSLSATKTFTNEVITIGTPA